MGRGRCCGDLGGEEQRTGMGMRNGPEFIPHFQFPFSVPCSEDPCSEDAHVEGDDEAPAAGRRARAADGCVRATDGCGRHLDGGIASPRSYGASARGVGCVRPWGGARPRDGWACPIDRVGASNRSWWCALPTGGVVLSMGWVRPPEWMRSRYPREGARDRREDRSRRWRESNASIEGQGPLVVGMRSIEGVDQSPARLEASTPSFG
jgi:hypothetical protein